MTAPLPTQVTYGTFKGKLIDAINTGAGELSRAVTGTVTASPAVNSVNIPAALVVMLPRPVTVTLDANGAFTMQLVATDDPALSIINWAYQISFQLGNGDALAPFLVQIPGGATVDLSTANPVSTGGGVAITQGPVGPPGPAAGYDADAVPYLPATAPAPTGPGVQPTARRLVTEASALLAGKAPDYSSTFTDASNLNSTQAIGAGAFTTILLNNVGSGPANFDTTTGLYTVPSSGLYLVTAKMRPPDGFTVNQPVGIGVDTVSADSAVFKWTNFGSGTRSVIDYTRTARFTAGQQLRLFMYGDAAFAIFRAQMTVLRVAT